MSALKVGLAEVDYAPDVGLPIMGHIRQDYASMGVHDPLYCKAAVFEDAPGNRLALVTMDICMLDRQKVAFFRRKVAQSTSIPAENILLAATHTHAGPATAAPYGCPSSPAEQIETFLNRATQAVVRAAADVQPAALRIGRARERRVSFNRRLRRKDGSTAMNWTLPDPATVAGPLGPVDDELLALSVDCGGCQVGALVNFPLHPAIIDHENWLYSADYPGYMAESLGQIKGEDFLTLFFNGCCGNINHIDYADKDSPRRGFVMAQRVGYMLGARAAQAINHGVEISGSPIAAVRQAVALNRIAISQERYEWAQRTLDEAGSGQRKPIDGLDAEVTAKLLIRLYHQQHEPDEVEVMAVRIGPLGIVSLPGEVFTEFGMDIKRRSPAPYTMAIELANDAVGYLPTAEAFGQGGYEVTPGVTAYEKGSGERLRDAALRLLNDLFE